MVHILTAAGSHLEFLMFDITSPESNIIPFSEYIDHVEIVARSSKCKTIWLHIVLRENNFYLLIFIFLYDRSGMQFNTSLICTNLKTLIAIELLFYVSSSSRDQNQNQRPSFNF